ncbi:MAG: hypothetical protein AAF602_25135 [Myxococcota bacterium]
MSEHRLSGQRTWTLRTKDDAAQAGTKKAKPVQWTKATSGWAPTAWRRSS